MTTMICENCRQYYFNAEDYFTTDENREKAIESFRDVFVNVIEDEPFFTGHKCETCGELPGDQYEVEIEAM